MRYVYLFHEGNARMKELLGGKGANLAEMTNIGLPVPCGMTITTDACREYYNNGKKLPEGLVEEVTRNLKAIEEEAGKRFGDEDDPLLLSVRSGAVFSMPGMMDTILNLGLNAATFKALARHTGNMWFACDTYRRFIQMFSDVVMEIPKDKFEHILQEQKAAQGVTQDQELSVESLLAVIDKSKALYRQEIEEDFPEDVTRQLFLSIEAVFRSWNNHRAIVYRNLNKIDQSGDRRQYPDNGLRQHGRRLGQRRGLLAQPFHRREEAVRRIPDQRAGRGRGGGRAHPPAHSRTRRGYAGDFRTVPVHCREA